VDCPDDREKRKENLFFARTVDLFPLCGEGKPISQKKGKKKGKGRRVLEQEKRKRKKGRRGKKSIRYWRRERGYWLSQLRRGKRETITSCRRGKKTYRLGLRVRGMDFVRPLEECPIEQGGGGAGANNGGVSRGLLAQTSLRKPLPEKEKEGKRRGQRWERRGKREENRGASASKLAKKLDSLGPVPKEQVWGKKAKERRSMEKKKRGETTARSKP